jgi:hypothetical protein
MTEAFVLALGAALMGLVLANCFILAAVAPKPKPTPIPVPTKKTPPPPPPKPRSWPDDQIITKKDQGGVTR